MPEEQLFVRDTTTFGARIQELRRARKLTQRQAAEALGIDFTYLSKLENDRGETAGDDLIRRLAALYEADAEDLLASAGKVPAELRARAAGDREFAVFLRQLPGLSEDKLRSIYRTVKDDEGADG